MLHQCPTTIPAEIRDYPEWRRGRDTYAVWVLPVDNGLIQTKFMAAREHLSGYLLEPYRRQPHITLFVCGFLVEKALYNDDFTPAQVQSQLKGLEEASIPPFEIEIGGLNSFASAPFLEVSNPDGCIGHLRETLSRGAREFRTAPYTPHLTVGLYAGAFPSKKVAERMMQFPANPVKLKIEQIAFATYQAREITGGLTHRQEIFLTRVPPGI